MRRQFIHTRLTKNGVTTENGNYCILVRLWSYRSTHTGGGNVSRCNHCGRLLPYWLPFTLPFVLGVVT